MVPVGAVLPDHSVLDIGPRTAAEWRSRLGQSNCVLWNGPLEMTPGSARPEGTLAVLAALGEGPAFSLVGPDSAPLAGSLGMDPARFGHVTRGRRGGSPAAARQEIAGSRAAERPAVDAQADEPASLQSPNWLAKGRVRCQASPPPCRTYSKRPSPSCTCSRARSSSWPCSCSPARAEASALSAAWRPSRSSAGAVPAIF